MRPQIATAVTPASLVPAPAHYRRRESRVLAMRLIKSAPMPGAPAPALFRGVTPVQRRTLLAAALGWMLDAFDVMLYAMVIAYIMHDLGITKSQAGLLNTLTLLASG